jgi:hypothetical protein
MWQMDQFELIDPNNGHNSKLEKQEFVLVIMMKMEMVKVNVKVMESLFRLVIEKGEDQHHMRSSQKVHMNMMMCLPKTNNLKLKIDSPNMIVELRRRNSQS